MDNNNLVFEQNDKYDYVISKLLNDGGDDISLRHISMSD